MIHAIGAIHAALRAKSKRKRAPSGRSAKEGATRPNGAPAEKPERRKD